MTEDQNPNVIEFDDDDLKELFDSLPTPAGASREQAERDKRAQEVSYLAARAMGQFTATRRVLYVYQRRCLTCGAVHSMPSDRVLTEYQHRDGTKKHATESFPDPGLPMQTDYLNGKSTEACHLCFNTPMPEE